MGDLTELSRRGSQVWCYINMRQRLKEYMLVGFSEFSRSNWCIISLWKMYSCSNNCTWNHVITYMNYTESCISEIVQWLSNHSLIFSIILFPEVRSVSFQIPHPLQVPRGGIRLTCYSDSVVMSVYNDYLLIKEIKIMVILYVHIHVSCLQTLQLY